MLVRIAVNEVQHCTGQVMFWSWYIYSSNLRAYTSLNPACHNVCLSSIKQFIRKFSAQLILTTVFRMVLYPPFAKGGLQDQPNLKTGLKGAGNGLS